MTFNIPDLDIDVKDSSTILDNMKHIPASKINNKAIMPHGVGTYFSNIPQDLITGLASIDYKVAEEEYGFVKVDLLHNTVYDRYSKRSELYEVLDKPIKWELLDDEKFVEELPHIGSYYQLMSEMPIINSITKLAMFIAIIRPGKSYLIDEVKKNGWKSVVDKIWVKEETGYMYKKSHAISYALMISTLLR